MQYENQLIPVLREGVDIIKMILFKKLKELLSRKYPDREASHVSKLAGAVINELFGTPNPDPVFKEFVRENRGQIDEGLRNIAEELETMRIPLTDALRVQFLCDHQEGVDSSAMLHRAKQLRILILDRDVPLPAKFMNLVRRLGGAHDLIHDPAR